MPPINYETLAELRKRLAREPMARDAMLVSGLVAGFVLGSLRGNWRNLQTLDLRLWPGLLAGVIARAAAPLLGGFALGASVAGILLVALVALVNRALSGAWLIVWGRFLTPSSRSRTPACRSTRRARRVGKPAPSDGLHVILSPETRLPFLADVLLIPVINNIYSVGDVVLAIGGFWMAFRLLKPR